MLSPYSQCGLIGVRMAPLFVFIQCYIWKRKHQWNSDPCNKRNISLMNEIWNGVIITPRLLCHVFFFWCLTRTTAVEFLLVYQMICQRIACDVSGKQLFAFSTPKYKQLSIVFLPNKMSAHFLFSFSCLDIWAINIVSQEIQISWELIVLPTRMQAHL